MVTARDSPERARSGRVRCGRKCRLLLILLAAFTSLTGCYTTNRILSSRRAIRTFSDSVHHVGSEQPQVLQTEYTESPQFRIAAYNIAHGRGNGSDNWDGGTTDERVQRLRDIARFLRDENLDVVVLNEVDFDSSWSHGVNQAEYLAREAGFRYRGEQRNFDVDVPLRRWRFGNAVLSRHPISDARLVEYPAYSRWESLLAGQKNGLVCTIELPNQEKVRVLAVHLSHRSERIRIASAKVIAAERQRAGPPLIAVGDFNSTPVEFPMAETDAAGRTAISWLLEEGGFDTLLPTRNSAERMTFSSTTPNRVIDWILVDERLRLVTQDVPPLTLSDHRPVVGVIEWAKRR